MRTSQPLDAADIRHALRDLPPWRWEGEALKATWRFASFAQAVAWMQAQVGDIDRLDHHPQWTNVYNRVDVVLTTHDAGNRVTERDLVLAGVLAASASAAGAQAISS
jgi:4a-hydroxytetrahydrobiopterin dehydratase